MDRISNLREGYVLDVSNMQSNGLGIRVVPWPMNSNTPTFGPESLPIMKMWLMFLDLNMQDI